MTRIAAITTELTFRPCVGADGAAYGLPPFTPTFYRLDLAQPPQAEGVCFGRDVWEADPEQDANGEWWEAFRPSTKRAWIDGREVTLEEAYEAMNR